MKQSQQTTGVESKIMGVASRYVKNSDWLSAIIAFSLDERAAQSKDQKIFITQFLCFVLFVFAIFPFCIHTHSLTHTNNFDNIVMLCKGQKMEKNISPYRALFPSTGENSFLFAQLLMETNKTEFTLCACVLK